MTVGIETLNDMTQASLAVKVHILRKFSSFTVLKKELDELANPNTKNVENGIKH